MRKFPRVRRESRGPAVIGEEANLSCRVASAAPGCCQAFTWAGRGGNQEIRDLEIALMGALWYSRRGEGLGPIARVAKARLSYAQLAGGEITLS